MDGRNLLADARSLLGAASSTSDPDLKILYTGKARSTFAQLRGEVDMLEREIAAVEAELARTAKK